MGKPRPFTTLPASTIADTSLTALDMRCLAAIAYHDGMSASRGTGGGCYARNDTLAALVRTDTTNFSKCLSKLIRLGYVTREPQLSDKRRFTLRVQYPTDDSWRTDQQSTPEKIGQLANNGGEIVGEATNRTPKVVGDSEGGNGSFSNETSQQYISLNEEIDFEESNEINSENRRDFAVAQRSGNDFRDHLPSSFGSLTLPAKLSHLERAWKAIDRDPARMTDADFNQVTGWLQTLADVDDDENVRQQAARLYEEMAYAD